MEDIEFFTVLEDMIELKKAPAGMVKNAIQNDVHPAPVGLIQQFEEDRVLPQNRVHMPVIIGVVAVVGGGHEDRVEVERVDPEVLQIVQFLIDAQQIPALKACPRQRRIPRFDIGGLFKIIGFCKTVGENLVKDRVFDPVRCIRLLSHCVRILLLIVMDR